MDTIFFLTQADLRKWFKKNHNKSDELWIGYYKKDSGKPGITYKESVDEALCFGWIDGIRKSIDSKSYKTRFTPRRKGSIWSAINIARIKELIKSGQVEQAGIDAFNKLNPKKITLYSFEQGKIKLTREYEKRLKSNKKACLPW